MPGYENAETFLNCLARQDVLFSDPLVKTALQGQLPETPPRTLRYRFLRATGQTQSHIRQVERAGQA